MTKLDARLARGPLRVRNLWSAELTGAPRAADPPAPALLLRARRGRRLRVPRARARSPRTGASARGVAGGRSPVAAAPGSVNAFADGSVAEPSSRDTELHVEEDTPGRRSSPSSPAAPGSRSCRITSGPSKCARATCGCASSGRCSRSSSCRRGRRRSSSSAGASRSRGSGGEPPRERARGTFPPSRWCRGRGRHRQRVRPHRPRPPAPPPASAASARRTLPAGRGRLEEDAKAGDYGKAYEELSAKGRDAVRDEAEDLMLAADVARLSAHPEEAIRPLRGVCDRHSSDRRAPVAAFTLGRVLLDDLGRPDEAAAAFQEVAPPLAGRAARRGCVRARGRRLAAGGSSRQRACRRHRVPRAVSTRSTHRGDAQDTRVVNRGSRQGGGAGRAHSVASRSLRRRL